MLNAYSKWKIKSKFRKRLFSPWAKNKLDIDMLAIYEKATGRSAKKIGGGFIACCPYHDDRNPSFAIYQEKQFFKCYGCGKHGSAYQFKQDMESRQ